MVRYGILTTSERKGIMMDEQTYTMIEPYIADIEQVLREKKPFILRCILDGIKKLQRRTIQWNRCALSVSITWA
jgi:hypothetical protein